MCPFKLTDDDSVEVNVAQVWEAGRQLFKLNEKATGGTCTASAPQNPDEFRNPMDNRLRNPFKFDDFTERCYKL